MKTSTAVGNATYDKDSRFLDCINGEVYVVAEEWDDIFSILSKEHIISIEYIGFGYTLDPST